MPQDGNAAAKEAAILRRSVPDTDALVSLALRLVACVSTAGYHGAVATLDRVPRDQLPAVLRRAGLDPETQRGADRWLLERAGGLDRALLDEFLKPAAERLLADRGLGLRNWAVSGLRNADHPDSVVLLRRLLDSPDVDERFAIATILVSVKQDNESYLRIRAMLPEFGDRDLGLLGELLADPAQSETK